MSDNKQQTSIPAHLWIFAVDQDRLKLAAGQIRGFLQELLDEAAIQVYSIESRAKSLTSYKSKSEKLDDSGQLKYSEPPKDIHDCVAARVIVFTHGEHERACRQIRENFFAKTDRNPGFEKRNGYDSQHFEITGLRDTENSVRGKLDMNWYLDTGLGFEVQVRTVAGHAWAEYEHDVRYKPSGYADLESKDKAKIDQLFTEAGGLRKYMDAAFSEIERALRPPTSTEDAAASTDSETVLTSATEFDLPSLASWLEKRYPEATPVDAATTERMLTLLKAARLTTIEQVEEAIARIDTDHVASLMDYQVSPTTVRRLDDELLAALGKKYIDSTSESTDARRMWLLETRRLRLTGKVLIYEINGAETISSDVRFSAAGAFRAIVKLVADEQGLDAATIEGAVSAQDNLDASTRAKAIETTSGQLWVQTNLTRAFAEELIGQLFQKLGSKNIRLLKAGEEVLATSPETNVSI